MFVIISAPMVINNALQFHQLNRTRRNFNPRVAVAWYSIKVAVSLEESYHPVQ